jgi:glycosyltransferase involved in cell wall biosynthesis
MKVGTLLLASEIPVFKEIYSDHAIYFNQLDFSSISKTMRDAIGMRNEEREMRIRKAQEFVKRYSWDKMARQTLKLYEDIYKAKGSNSVRSGK